MVASQHAAFSWLIRAWIIRMAHQLLGTARSELLVGGGVVSPGRGVCPRAGISEFQSGVIGSAGEFHE